MSKESFDPNHKDFNYNNAIDDIIDSLRMAINHKGLSYFGSSFNNNHVWNKFETLNTETIVIGEFKYEITFENKIKIIVNFIEGNYPSYTKNNEIFIYVNELSVIYLNNELWRNNSSIYNLLSKELTNWLDRNLDKIKTRRRFNPVNIYEHANLYKEHKLEIFELNNNFEFFIKKEFSDKYNNRNFSVKDIFKISDNILDSDIYSNIPFSKEELRKHKKIIIRKIINLLNLFKENPNFNIDTAIGSVKFTDPLIIYGLIEPIEW